MLELDEKSTDAKAVLWKSTVKFADELKTIATSLSSAK